MKYIPITTVIIVILTFVNSINFLTFKAISASTFIHKAMHHT